METNLRIRAFRATDDFKTCLMFYEGHKKVLENHGIYKVTSLTADWMYSKSVFLIVVENMDGDKLYGGARLQAADNIMLLPIETATMNMDPLIHKYVVEYSMDGTGEICGLWNSIEVAGLGIGSLFPTRVALIITKQLGLNTLFSLCSPATLRFTKWMGGRIFNEVGNNGTFYYPKIDLLATVILLENMPTLEDVHTRERDKMLFLRENPCANIKEKSPFKNVEVNVQYDLKINGSNKTEFKYKGKIEASF